MNFFAFSALLSGLTSFLLGLFALARGYKNTLNKFYAFFALAVFIWCFGYFFWQISTTAPVALFWTRVLMVGAVLIPVSYFNFTLQLTRKYEEKKSESILSYLVGLVFIAFNFTPLMVTHVSPKLFFEFWPNPGVFFPPFLAMFFFYAGYSLVIMYFVFRQASGHLKSQIKYVFLGTAVGFIGGSTNFLLWYDIPVVPYATILVLAYPVLISYAITKYRLMDMAVVISRTFAEILTIISFGAMYFGVLWFFITYIEPGLSWPLILTLLVYGFLVGHNYLKLRLFFQTSADKVFLHGKYDYYKALSEASARVGEKLSLKTILEIMYQTFSEVVEISNPRVFLPEHFTNPEIHSKRYVVYDKKTCQPVADGEAIDLDDKLVAQLVASRQPILDLHDPMRELIVPCLLEDRLIAIFVLGRKLSEDPYTDEDIKLIEVLANQAAIALDHTRSYEKITADLEAAENQLSRSQRLASIGTLMAGVTHEIRNPLTVVRAETERIAKEPRDLNALQAYRDLVLKHVDRIAGIVLRMLAMAREKPKEESDVNLNEAIEAALQLVPLKNVKVQKELRRVPTIRGIQGEIEEIFMNLVQNAIEAMSGTGTLTIKTYEEDGRLVAEVTDTGKGIPEELREKIFDPFFSTRHEGTGLGLSIVYRIVREMGGDIKVISGDGQGTTFKITF